MVLLYGRRYLSRYRAIAELVPPKSTVLDVCCGPGILYRRYLRSKSVSYTGIDMNTEFIDSVVRYGGAGEVRDLRTCNQLPSADYVIMQASLYHFLPDPRPILTQMGVAAKVALIVAEPVRNLAHSRVRLVRTMASLFTDAGSGAQSLRFTEQLLDSFFLECFQISPEALYIPGGREKMYVVPTRLISKSKTQTKVSNLS